MGYKNLTIIQFIFIFLAAFVVFDYAYITASATDGLFIYNMLFDYNDGLIGSILSDMKIIWTFFHFVGYCMIIVGLIQFLKASSVNA